MPRRTLLSADQRARLFAVPVAEPELARHYMLSPADLGLIRIRRRGSNRLGFAVQLCTLRYPGRTLGPSETPPEEMLAFVADQLGVDAGLFGKYAQRAETRREHALELQQYLGLRPFRLADWRACLRVGADAAWATDRGEPIVFAILGHLRATNVLLPGAEVLERIGLAARPVPVALPFTCWRTASPTRIKRIWSACSRSMPVSVDRGLHGFAIALSRRHPPTWWNCLIGSSSSGGWAATRRGHANPSHAVGPVD